MEKEKELHEGEWWNTCPYRNERPGCRHCEITRNIVAEATRRGIQQGKREAWEEAKEIVANFTPTHITRDYRDTDAMRDNIVHVFNVELSALNNSSKE